MDPRDRTFSEVHSTRRSVRSFTGEVVSRELLTAVVEEATLAPSSYNRQPWRVVAVRDDELEPVLPALGSNAEKVRSAGTLLALFADLDLDERTASFYDGSLARTPVEYGVRNTALLAMAIMDTAWSHGLGTTPMIGFDPVALAEALDVPEHWHPVLVMPLGWPAEGDHGNAGRRPVDEVLTIRG